MFFEVPLPFGQRLPPNLDFKSQFDDEIRVADHLIGTRLHFLANLTTESPNTPSHAELQDILGYRFSNPLLLDEATLTRGGGPTQTVTPQNTHGNKPLALVGDALIRLDVGVRAYAEGTGTGKHLCTFPHHITCTK